MPTSENKNETKKKKQQRTCQLIFSTCRESGKAYLKKKLIL